MLPLAVHIALALGFAESLGLAGLLWLRAGKVPGIGYLALFLIGVAAWVLSCEAPSWFGPGAVPLGRALVAASPLTSAVYLHFVTILARMPLPRPTLRAIYAVAGLAGLAGLAWPAGHYEAWKGLDYFFMPDAMGWVIGSIWAALSIAGHGVLFLAWLRGGGTPRSQLVAMCLASGWGLMSMAGYGARPLGVDLFPYSLLLLPAYPVILVYGILRYQLMIVNAWARRAVAWTLLVGIGSAVVIGLAALPLPLGGVNSGWRLWAVAVATLLVAGLLLDPFRRLATRIVYPGSHVDARTIESWRQALAAADSVAALERNAADTLGRQLRIPIMVSLGEGLLPSDAPALHCRRVGETWQTDLLGWDAAPPGPQHVAQLFGTTLAEAAGRLERALRFAEREREQQQQARLAELGALAATVAHDIRNPLNIIAMAAAGAPPETRREIAAQTARISQLASDLLDYAKAWQIERRPLDLADQIQAILPRYPEIVLAPGLPTPLTIAGDARRLAQAFYNLFDNARAAKPGRIAIEADLLPQGGVALHVCDDGPGIPPEIRTTLFQPFVSRSTGGTGLGLAIVAKVMAAHGGSAAVTDRPGWTTCFTLIFPPPEAA
jgi:signal transduction histidine kinase